MAGEFDQRNGATSFMSGVPQTQGPYEYQILSYLQQPISQTLIGQGAHQPFGQNAQQSYAQAFANYQLQENPYAHPPLQNRPSYPAQQPAAGASTFGGIQLRMEEDQRPEGGYVSDPSESPAQMRRRRESFR
ncbi:hypothetical protein FGO68_gene6275 [Halteria grandinella]|uniref:Uncharacterized protein n=1 Tax=Halteria grandinella TaxID=5974 RepID=A0A8J8P2U4_HALGN|nr:hypothetical protein FGO68_gene6275 [Halteria grandinella]